jgi:flavin-dependent dehydrogenase
MTEGDVIIVDARPAGMMLAVELRLARVRPLVLEREPQPRETPKANRPGSLRAHGGLSSWGRCSASVCLARTPAICQRSQELGRTCRLD